MEAFLETILANAGKARREQLNGRSYFVLPITSIVPGVLPGSQGPLYYPPDEVARNHDMWNGVPLTNGHPKDEGGRHVSARSPKVLARYQIGTVYNTGISGGNLVHEGWFDEELVKNADERFGSDILNRLRNDLKTDVSTGLFTENEAVQNGEFNGERYTHVARNYRADHLAVLPFERGACSVNDGCGVNVNERGLLARVWDAVVNAFALNFIKKSGDKYKVMSESGKELGEYGSEAEAKKRLAQIEYFKHKDATNNANGEFPGQPSPTPMPSPKDMTPKEQQNNPDDPDAQESAAPTDESDALKKKRASPVTNAEVAMKDRKQKVAFLVANCDCWKGQDKVLSNEAAMPEAVLDNLIKNHETAQRGQLVLNSFLGEDGQPKEIKTKDGFKVTFNLANEAGVIDGESLTVNAFPPAVDPKKKKQPNGDAETAAEGGAGEQTKEDQIMSNKFSLNEYLDKHGTEEERQVWNTAKKINVQHKKGLVIRLVANVADDKRRNAMGNMLMNKSIEELEQLVELLPVQNEVTEQDQWDATRPQQRRANFTGAAGGPPSHDFSRRSAAVANAYDEEAQGPMLPTEGGALTFNDATIDRAMGRAPRTSAA